MYLTPCFAKPTVLMSRLPSNHRVVLDSAIYWYVFDPRIPSLADYYTVDPMSGESEEKQDPHLVG